MSGRKYPKPCQNEGAASDNNDDPLAFNVLCLPLLVIEKLLCEAAILNVAPLQIKSAEEPEVRKLYQHLRFVCRHWRNIVDDSHFERLFQRQLQQVYPCLKYKSATPLTITGVPMLSPSHNPTFSPKVAMLDKELYIIKNRHFIEVYRIDSHDDDQKNMAFSLVRTLHLNVLDLYDNVHKIFHSGESLYLFKSNWYEFFLFQIDKLTGAAHCVATYDRCILNKYYFREMIVADDLNVYKKIDHQGLVRSSMNVLRHGIGKHLVENRPEYLVHLHWTGGIVPTDSDGCIVSHGVDGELLVYSPDLKSSVTLDLRRGSFSEMFVNMWLDESRGILFFWERHIEGPGFSAYSIKS